MNKKQLKHKQASLAGMRNLTDPQVALQDALLVFWATLYADNPHISMDGTEIISVPQRQSSFNIVVNEKPYYRFPRLSGALQTAIKSVTDVKYMQQRTLRSLNALFLFYKEMTTTPMLTKIPVTPVYCINIRGFDGQIIDQDDLHKFLEQNQRAAEFNKENFIDLPILNLAMKTLQQNIAAIDLNSIPVNMRDDLVELKETNLNLAIEMEGLRHEMQGWSLLMKAQLEVLWCASVTAAKVIRPIWMPPLLKLATRFVIASISEVLPFLTPHAMYAVPLGVAATLSPWLISGSGREQKAYLSWLAGSITPGTIGHAFSGNTPRLLHILAGISIELYHLRSRPNPALDENELDDPLGATHDHVTASLLLRDADNQLHDVFYHAEVPRGLTEEQILEHMAPSIAAFPLPEGSDIVSITVTTTPIVRLTRLGYRLNNLANRG